MNNFILNCIFLFTLLVLSTLKHGLSVFLQRYLLLDQTKNWSCLFFILQQLDGILSKLSILHKVKKKNGIFTGYLSDLPWRYNENQNLTLY